MNQYLFTSNRLGFRNWQETELPGFTRLNADPEVMAFFPQLSPEELFFELDGERLQCRPMKGAKRCPEFAFKTLGLEQVVSVCPASNLPSETVMKRIGMQKKGEFEHPGLPGASRLSPCVWYEVKKT